MSGQEIPLSSDRADPSDQSDELGDEKLLSRRRLLETGVWASTGMIGLTLAAAGGRFVVGDAFEPAQGQWTAVGKVADFPAGQVHTITYRKRTKDAWRRVERPGLLYLFSEDGVEYRSLDATCSHLGCNVHWKEAANHFYCSCHDAYFSREGAVISGPPPAPLTARQTRVEDGVVHVLV